MFWAFDDDSTPYSNVEIRTRHAHDVNSFQNGTGFEAPPRHDALALACFAPSTRPLSAAAAVVKTTAPGRPIVGYIAYMSPVRGTKGLLVWTLAMAFRGWRTVWLDVDF